MTQPSLRIAFMTSDRLPTPKRIYRPTHAFFRIVSASASLETRPPPIKPGRGRIEACLKDHFADVSDQCKETISQAAGKS
jgi:hypothetical protein